LIVKVTKIPKAKVAEQRPIKVRFEIVYAVPNLGSGVWPIGNRRGRSRAKIRSVGTSETPMGTATSSAIGRASIRNDLRPTNTTLACPLPDDSIKSSPPLFARDHSGRMVRIVCRLRGRSVKVLRLFDRARAGR
jgi:hypothetical protein